MAMCVGLGVCVKLLHFFLLKIATFVCLTNKRKTKLIWSGCLLGWLLAWGGCFWRFGGEYSRKS